MNPMIGQTLGHYRIEAKLGQGGMGVVYRAFDTHLDRPVAIKILRADATTSPERKRRFVQEAKAASALNHPNIIHIYDISSSGDTDFIAMEFVAGKTLYQLIGKNGLPLRDTLKYSVQIADALARAHSAGIVHRDLKPANIIIAEDGRVKLLDFGLAKLTEKTVDSEAATATMAWRFKNVTSGTWSLSLFFSSLFCSTIQLIMAAVLLFAGGMDTEFLRREARKFAPWLRAFGLANGALAMIMAVWIAEGHTTLAALIAFLGIAIGVTALTLKPAMDRAAIYDSERS
jgi:serine/threonine protein kinase